MASSIEAIINRQLLRWEIERNRRVERKVSVPRRPQVVTVSREVGSRGSFFAGRLAERMGFQLLHREVIDAICTSSGYRRRIIESLDDRFRSDLDILAESLVTQQSVDHSDYHRHLVKIVLSMACLGGVVLVGRGGSFILGPLRGFHVRVLAPVERRQANLMKYRGLSQDDARDEVKRIDQERREMVKKLFGEDIDDPHHYDMVINLAMLELEDLIEPTVLAIKSKFEKLTLDQAGN